MLYSRHLRKGDVYVNADINNATPVFIKNSSSIPDSPIPPSTLTQAGSLVVSTSTAWQSKALMSAWWVPANQVSKLASSGDYLSPGSFEVGGKKNYLPPAPLLIGLASLFQVSEKSKARHKRHRLDQKPVANEAGAGADNGPDETPLTASEGAAENGQEKYISDSDEDFPDVDLQSNSNQSDSEDNEGPSNPLITSKGELTKSQSLSLRASSGNLDNAYSTDQKKPANGEPEGGQKKASSARKEQNSEELSDSEVTVEEANDKDNAESKILEVDAVSDELTVNHDTDPVNHTSQAPDNDDAMTKNLDPSQTQSKSSQLPRGKRGKQKKVAAKYAHQDESDRELALSLLGHKKNEPKKPSLQESEAAKAAELMQQKQRRREQHQRAQLDAKRKEEEHRAKMESNNEDIGEDVNYNIVDLDALIGTPLPGDEILAALPICAPWAALSNYKYKVKMQPGLFKKGKAIREILGKWEADFKDKKKVDHTCDDTEKIWPNEIEQIRAWKDTEVIGIVPVSKVRVVAPAAKSIGSQQSNKGKSSRGGRGSKKQR